MKFFILMFVLVGCKTSSEIPSNVKKENLKNPSIQTKLYLYINPDGTGYESITLNNDGSGILDIVMIHKDSTASRFKEDVFWTVHSENIHVVGGLYCERVINIDTQSYRYHYCLDKRNFNKLHEFNKMGIRKTYLQVKSEKIKNRFSELKSN